VKLPVAMGRRTFRVSFLIVEDFSGARTIEDKKKKKASF